MGPGGAPAGEDEAGGAPAGHTEQVALPLVLVLQQDWVVQTVEPGQAGPGTVHTALPEGSLQN